MFPIGVNQRVLRFLLFMLSNVLIFFAVACPSASAQGKVERNVVYCDELQKSCIGDVYEQDDPQLRPAPAVVVVHGGSWVTGEKDGADVKQVIEHLWRQGFVVFSVDYRLLKDGGTFPRNVEDVKRAVAYLENSATRYGADPTRVGVLGVSAGAYLALMASYSPFTPSKLEGLRFRLKACAALCPATDLTALQNPVILQYLQDGDEDFSDKLKSASPINYSRTAIPTLLEHGTADRVVPFAQSVQMASALKRSGIKVRFVKLENSGHDFIIQPGQNKDTAMREIVQFFNKNLASHG